jgi:hypothetical protein
MRDDSCTKRIILLPVTRYFALHDSLRNTGPASGGKKLRNALVNMGIPEEDADYYQNEFEAGRTIVTVRTTDRYEQVVGILRENGAYDVNTRQGT